MKYYKRLKDQIKSNKSFIKSKNILSNKIQINTEDKRSALHICLIWTQFPLI